MAKRKKTPPRGFKCRCCKKWHAELPLHYGAEAPLPYEDVPEGERAVRCELNRDLCVIDEEHFFIVGNLEIPILGHDELFSWDVWTSLSRKNFLRAHEVCHDPDRVSEPPYFGWLSTRLPGYPDTFLLKTHVHTRELGRRPYVEVEPTNHALAVEQRKGITWKRVQEIAEMILHDE